MRSFTAAISIFSIHLLSLLNASPLLSGNYDEHIQFVLELSRQQAAFIVDAWRIPHVSFNVAIEDWIYDEATDSNDPHVIMSWKTSYADMYSIEAVGPRLADWKTIKADNYEILSKHDGKAGKVARHNLQGVDNRPFIMNGKYYLMYNIYEQGYPIRLYLNEIYYDRKIDSLYLLEPPTQLVIEHEFGEHVAQKNWSPFQYRNQTVYTSMHHGYYEPELFFVHSINPHRIVQFDAMIARSGSTRPRPSYDDLLSHPSSRIKVSSVYVTEVQPSASRPVLWELGQPRGGTPSRLVNTKHGLRYLTFFHSQLRIAGILSYYTGAYLFSSQPPFGMTHITPQPLICAQCYNETYGWAFKAIDYIIFPLSYIIRKDDIVVSFGRNDKEGWLMQIQLAGLVDYMVPVQAKDISSKVLLPATAANA